jgi:hypothetical protein
LWYRFPFFDYRPPYLWRLYVRGSIGYTSPSGDFIISSFAEVGVEADFAKQELNVVDPNAWLGIELKL